MLLQAIINGVLLGGVYAAFSAGLSLIFGVMGVLNIAHGELLMLGAFTSVWLFQQWGLDPFLSLPVSFALMFGLGWLLQRLFINRVVDQPHVMSYILTFGLHLIIANVALEAWTADPRTITTSYSGAAWRLGPVSIPVVRAATCAMALALVGGLHLLLARTRLGRAIRATSLDREMARIMGINVGQVFAVTFGLGAGVTAVAGGLVASFQHVEVGMGLPYTVLAFCVVVLGGMGYIPGALVGGLVLGVTGSVVTVLLTPGWSLAVMFFLLYLVLLVRPTGLTGRGKAQ